MSGANTESEDFPSIEILDPTAASLARELSMDIRDPGDVLRDHGFTGPGDPRYIALAESRDYRKLLATLSREWNLIDSTVDRLRFKSLAIVEANLTVLHDIASAAAKDSDRIEAMKVVRSLAGLDPNGANNRNDGGGGSGTSININIGNDKVLTVTRSAPLIEGNTDSDE